MGDIQVFIYGVKAVFAIEFLVWGVGGEGCSPFENLDVIGSFHQGCDYLLVKILYFLEVRILEFPSLCLLVISDCHCVYLRFQFLFEVEGFDN
jgi:hypothetical protein